MKTKLRQNEHLLTILGKGILAFLLLNIAKIFFGVFFDNTINDTAQTKIDSDETLILILGLAVLIIAILDIVIRLIIGLSAIKEGKGKKKGYFYIILSILTIIGLSIETVYRVIIIFSASEDILLSLSSIVLNVTTIVALVWITYSSITVKKIRKELKASEGGV